MNARRRRQHAHLRLVHARPKAPVISDASLAALVLASVLLLLTGLWLIAMARP